MALSPVRQLQRCCWDRLAGSKPNFTAPASGSVPNLLPSTPNSASRRGFGQSDPSRLSDSGLGYEQMDFRIADVSGEQYGFKEAALAQLRSMRVRKKEFYIWHPADSIGEVGAATVPVILGMARQPCKKLRTRSRSAVSLCE